MTRNPVLLIHGIDDTTALFGKIAPYLQNRGFSVHSFNLVPNNGSIGLDKLAQQVARYIDRTFSPGQAIDLVGFSMGGIISRYYVQRLGGLNRVQRFVTIAAPHHGTWTAYFRPNVGASQMQRGSRFLADLNRDVDQLKRLDFTSIWTPLDLMILPAASSRMPVGRDVQLPVSGHAWMMTDDRCLQTVAQVLTEAPRQAPRRPATELGSLQPQLGDRQSA